MSQRRSRRVIIDDDEEMPGPSQGRRRNVNRNSDDEMSLWSQTQKSQRKKKSKSQNNSRNDDDDDSQSQASQSRSQKVPSEDELNRLMGHVVRYILVSDRSRYPILRQNIQKNVLNGSKYFRPVMEHAADTLKRVFGYELVSVDSTKYILVNEIANDRPHLTFSTEKTSMLLLFLALSHIFMSDEVCSEDSLWNFLRKLNIVDGDDFRHEHFGDVQQLISVEFVKQRYLTRSKIENSDPEKFQYQWGSRAERELNKLDVLNFVSRVFRNRPMESWSNQYKIAVQNQPQGREP
ncbi:non-structural maintenance of chromosomes element 3 homolog [Belonocnema kinseyi]|uniref:non-structural maintenance of chromosomes element 3 homolog n=1 Tax=Belonocnema kinseyi TaxID=2817044 RepID=UPI00143CD353|nr:non-structural maintenance of chromosomes element 3 homolog [Belonocnema kinseyi]